MNAIEKARQRSDEGISTLRQLALDVFGRDADLIIGTNGSYARREVTAGSDVDLFYLLSAKGKLEPSKRKGFEEKALKAGFKLPSEGGVFSKALRTNQLLKNIGGLKDSNASLTRRLLLLLEGEWLFNKQGYLKTRNELLAKYISDKTPKDKIALFLLNDIVRYWRTICVDYEYKTSDGKKPKGIRLVKLRFSRMLLVYGGIIAVAETFELESQQKLQRLEELFSLNVLERVRCILGEQAESATALYNGFLEALDNSTTRKILSQSQYEETVEFGELRRKGREFKEELLVLLVAKYPATHPIHKALLL